MITPASLLLVAAGGALGAVARYTVGVLSVRYLGEHFPWGTLGINIVGSLALGLLLQLVLRGAAPDSLRFLLGAGFLGAFTTFSTFSVETLGLLQQGRTRDALLYVLASLFVSVAAAAAGVWTADQILGPRRT